MAANAQNLPEPDSRRGFSFSNSVAVVNDIAFGTSLLAECLYVGATGDVTLITASGQTTLFKAVPAGQYIWQRCSQVTSAGTTATNIVALW